MNVKLDAGANSWQFYSYDQAFSTIIGNILNMKNVAARNERIASYNQKITDEFNAYLGLLDVIADETLHLQGFSDDAESKVFKACFDKGALFFINEVGKKMFDTFSFKVALNGDGAGKIEGDGAPTKASGLLKNLSDCTENRYPGKNPNLEIFRVISNKDVVIVCPGTGCFLLKQVPTPVTPAKKSKDQVVNSFQDIKAKGADPKRVSLATGRKVPSDILLPNQTSVATDSSYVPPCANVSDCAKWFCNNFISGPFARVEKVINPQDAKDDLDNQTSPAYNVKLNDTKRILADESVNELSPTGLNFIAVAEATSLTTTVSVDGIDEAAAGFNSSIQANSTLDSNSAGGVISNNPSNNNGSPKITIQIALSVIVSLLVLLI